MVAIAAHFFRAHTRITIPPALAAVPASTALQLIFRHVDVIAAKPRVVGELVPVERIVALVEPEEAAAVLEHGVDDMPVNRPA